MQEAEQIPISEMSEGMLGELEDWYMSCIKQFAERKKALNEEKMTNLKGQLITLSDEDIVISSGKEIISLAGIIGSKGTSVNSKTINILIESAFFDPSSIKKTARRLDFSTQASQHFSKRYNLPFGNYALTRTIELIKEIYPNKVEKSVIS